MSNATTARSATPRPAVSRRPQPRLRVVTGSEVRRSRTGFTVLCSTLLALGLLALLLLNTARAEQSFALGELQKSSTSLSDNERQLRSDISNVSAPQQVALKAQEMGMVPAPQVAYVRSSDGKVLGVADRAPGDNTFTVGTLPDTPASRVADSAVKAAETVRVQPPKPKPKPSAKPSASASPKASGSSAPKASSSKDTSSSTKPSASKPSASRAAAKPTP
ncbi:hypothetical protein [Demetria terragena]|uniref:hypothetical protein n=1 Tax=Demetria terragena TaxID=63959 RepID=UPI0012E9A3BD|nr:hypothetical protein [Demetria terragena]